MSINKYRPHVLVLPEDDADRQLANGFALHFGVDTRSIQVLPIAGGWEKVVERFYTEHSTKMQHNMLVHAVLLLDFDGRSERFQQVHTAIPGDLRDRVFVIGLWTEPEDLFAEGLPTKEELGEALASECFQNRRELWNHRLLMHNSQELIRMNDVLRPILFKDA